MFVSSFREYFTSTFGNKEHMALKIFAAFFRSLFEKVNSIRIASPPFFRTPPRFVAAGLFLFHLPLALPEFPAEHTRDPYFLPSTGHSFFFRAISLQAASYCSGVSGFLASFPFDFS
jgi:hypothetical protein